jgi:hypothetical protein
MIGASPHIQANEKLEVPASWREQEIFFKFLRAVPVYLPGEMFLHLF